MMNVNKFSIFGIFANSLATFWDFLSQGKLIFSYALAMSFLAFITANMPSCAQSSNWWCLNGFYSRQTMLILLPIYIVMMLFLIFAFMYDLYQLSIKKEKFSLKMLYSFSKQKLKIIFGGFAYMLTLFTLFGISLWFAVSKPNPDWRIEGLKFLFIFSSGLLFLFFLRISALFGGAFSKNKLSIGSLLKHTQKKSYVVLVSFCLFFLLIVFLFSNFSYAIRYFTFRYQFFAVAFLGKVVGDAVKLTIAALFLAFFHAEDKIVQKLTEEHDAVEKVADKPIKENKTALKKAPSAEKKQKKRKNKQG